MESTKITVYTLLDYEAYYGKAKDLEEAKRLIHGIPSATLLGWLSMCSVNLYLNENNEKTAKLQFSLVNTLLKDSPNSVKSKWKDVVTSYGEINQQPIIFYTHSNLKFYNLIFQNHNDLKARVLNHKECKNIFDAYLIINQESNGTINITEEEVSEAEKNDKVEDIFLPNFIQQRDYFSSTDFSNQITRGKGFFDFLNDHTTYQQYLSGYFKEKGVCGYMRMFRNLFSIFSEGNVAAEIGRRNYLIDLNSYVLAGEVDVRYIDSLSINTKATNYESDESFTILRNKFLYRVEANKYYILDINFLLDHFYKSQVFAFNKYLKGNNVRTNFLSDKGKEFSDKILLPKVLNSCFPHLTNFYGDECKTSSGGELCDAYLRDDQTVAIIEFKDVLLNASVKNEGGKGELYSELDKKFVSNQKGKAKGITQLINAIENIDRNRVSFDTIDSIEKVYPIIVYTDFSFGADGINKRFKEAFIKELEVLELQRINVKDITFISLSYFEIHEDYLSGKHLNLFKVIDLYHEHTSIDNNSLTPFEVFSRKYMNENVSLELGPPSSFRTLIPMIIES